MPDKQINPFKTKEIHPGIIAGLKRPAVRVKCWTEGCDNLVRRKSANQRLCASCRRKRPDDKLVRTYRSELIP